MSTRIDGIALVAPRHRLHSDALHLAVVAIREALHQVGEVPGDADLIINAGLYRDRNLGEPALAPLIQADVGANPEDHYRGGTGTFSFDVANGTCGPLTALQVADGLLRAGTAETVVIVASDADPGHGLAPDFPFRPAGGALVCHATDRDRGLGAFRWRNSPDEGRSFRATIELENGTNLLTISEDPSFPELAGHLAAAAAADLLQDESIDVGAVDLVVAAPANPIFTKTVATDLDIPEERIVTAGSEFHTAAFIAALDLARSTGRFEPGSTVQFLCAAAGITAGAALYRP
jgi:3-oxoacyl-[acyl-carrier-protein] synthase-3